MRSRWIATSWISFLALAVIFVGCGEPAKNDEGKESEKKEEKAEGSGKKDEEATMVSFSKDLMPLFERSCGVCHKREGGNEHAVENGVYYEKKGDVLSKVGKYIIAGKPEESGLLKILNQTMKVGDSEIVMPPPGKDIPPWSKEELEKFTTWIKEGAKDN
ncbi:MAG: hypothetical protein ACYTFG_03235 [Planctomycetota bacterium]|jgi:hypothetical protein